MPFTDCRVRGRLVLDLYWTVEYRKETVCYTGDYRGLLLDLYWTTEFTEDWYWVYGLW